jgi:hypothetical protein
MQNVDIFINTIVYNGENLSQHWDRGLNKGRDRNGI